MVAFDNPLSDAHLVPSTDNHRPCSDNVRSASQLHREAGMLFLEVCFTNPFTGIECPRTLVETLSSAATHLQVVVVCPSEFLHNRVGVVGSIQGPTRLLARK